MKKLLLILLRKTRFNTEKQIGNRLITSVREELEMSNYVKKHIKPEEKILILLPEEGDTGREEIIRSTEFLLGKNKYDENMRYIELKSWYPDIDKTDILELYKVYAQLLDDDYNGNFIARKLYGDILDQTARYLKLENIEHILHTLYKKPEDSPAVKLVLEEYGDLVDIDSFNILLRDNIEKYKEIFNADKYLLYHIHRINEKLEKNEELTDEERAFTRYIKGLYEDGNKGEKLIFNKTEKYGKKQVENFFSRLNTNTLEYTTIEQLKTGERLLEETEGYEEHIETKELIKLAEVEQNMLYLAKKRKIATHEIIKIINKKKISENALIELYNCGALNLKQIKEYAKKMDLNIDGIKQEIRFNKGDKLASTNLLDEETWELLTTEEKRKAIIAELKNGNNEIIKKVKKEELEKIYDLTEISNLYRQIYVKGNTEKIDEYKDQIKIYNLVQGNQKEDIIDLLDDELSDEMLINLYNDNLINLKLLKSYGDKELVKTAYNKGIIKVEDIKETIKICNVELTKEETIKYYNKGAISIKDIIEFYLKGNIKFDILRDLKSDIAPHLSQEKLINQYREGKKKKDLTSYKKYALLYQSFREDKLDEKMKEKNNKKALKAEDIVQFYDDNLLTIDALINYGGGKFIEQLLIEGKIKQIDVPKVIRNQTLGIDIEQILQNTNMDEEKKLSLIFDTYPDNKEKRDELVSKYILIFGDVNYNQDDGKSYIRNGKNGKKVRRTVTDPCKRWELLGLLDKDHSKTYLGGYLLVRLNNSQKNIIEKLYDKKGNRNEYAYGTATFIMDTEFMINHEKEIIKDGKLDINAVRALAKENKTEIRKITHHPPVKDSKGKEVSNYAKRLVGAIGEEFYSQEELDAINKCGRELEASREVLK